MPRPALKPHQESLLRTLLAEERAVPVDELDGRVVRALASRRLVVVRNGEVIPTGAGRAAIGSSVGPQPGGPEDTARLSEAQEDLLWMLQRRSDAMLADHLDGRILRGLRERGLVEEKEGWVALTEAGRAHGEVRRPTRRREAKDPRTARAASILRAVELLEQSLPSDAEIEIGRASAYADDVLLALRRTARELGEG